MESPHHIDLPCPGEGGVCLANPSTDPNRTPPPVITRVTPFPSLAFPTSRTPSSLPVQLKGLTQLSWEDEALLVVPEQADMVGRQDLEGAGRS